MSFVVPDACTLPTVEQPLRLAEFDTLFATAVRDVETVGPTHARMRMTGPAGLAATVRDLTARETECCSFFSFTVTPEPGVDGEALTLDVRVPAQYADVLASLAGRAGTVAAHMSLPLQTPTSYDGHQHATPTVDNLPPTRSKVSGVLAVVACAVCCALPLLIAAGVLTTAGAAILEKTLLAVAAGLVVLALGMWWLHRRRSAQRAAAAGATCGCGGGGC